MRQLQLAFLLLALMSASGGAAEPLSNALLIVNGDFEADANSDQWPDGWARAKSGVTWRAEEGNHFLRLVSEKPGETVMLFHAVKLPEGCRKAAEHSR